jgi:hypothetical protein
LTAAAVVFDKIFLCSFQQVVAVIEREKIQVQHYKTNNVKTCFFLLQYCNQGKVNQEIKQTKLEE